MRNSVEVRECARVVCESKIITGGYTTWSELGLSSHMFTSSPGTGGNAFARGDAFPLSFPPSFPPFALAGFWLWGIGGGRL